MSRVATKDGHTAFGKDTLAVGSTIVLLHAWRGRGRCGVADYTQHLAQALRSSGISVRALCMPDWTMASIRAVRAGLIGRNPRELIVHLQYPSLDAGRSLWPAALRFIMPASPLVVTLHEFEAFHPARKAALSIYAAQARAVVLTNDNDRSCFERWYWFARRRTHVIPIGSNIPIRGNLSDEGRTIAAAFFGQLRRRRGLESFFAFAGTLRQQGIQGAIACIGAVVEQDSSFEQWLRELARTRGVDLHLNVSPDAVSNLLAASALAYLPFPDGLSERRGSVLACLDHGVTILSTHTPRTPSWLRDATIHTTSPENAAVCAKELLCGAREAPGLSVEAEGERRLREWPMIADRHCVLYQSLCGAPQNTR